MKKCPACGESIYVRNRQLYKPDGLCTEAEAVAIELAKTLAMGRAAIVERISKLGSVEAGVWSCFEQEAPKTRDPQDHRDIYLAAFYYLKASGEDTSEVRAVLRKAVDALNRRELREARELSDAKPEFEVVKVAVNGDCEACRALQDREFTLAEVKKNPPLPVADCTCEEGCICEYI